MPPVGFEPTISADERQQTYALDRAATGTGVGFLYLIKTRLIEITCETHSASSSLVYDAV